MNDFKLNAVVTINQISINSTDAFILKVIHVKNYMTY